MILKVTRRESSRGRRGRLWVAPWKSPPENSLEELLAPPAWGSRCRGWVPTQGAKLCQGMAMKGVRALGPQGRALDHERRRRRWNGRVRTHGAVCMCVGEGTCVEMQFCVCAHVCGYQHRRGLAPLNSRCGKRPSPRDCVPGSGSWVCVPESSFLQVCTECGCHYVCETEDGRRVPVGRVCEQWRLAPPCKFLDTVNQVGMDRVCFPHPRP